MSTTHASAAADVVVVGGGASGLTAAVTAAERGARVILVEKNAQLGGTTRLAVGSFSAAGTRLQHRANVSDSPAAFIDDMAASNGELERRENVELRATLANNAGEAFDWLNRLGVQFFGPTPEPPFRNPRMHNVLPGAKAYIDVLSRYARRVGVEVKLGFAVSELLRDDTGRVSGVQGPEQIRAGAVVLAAGDYSASPELKREWVSDQASRLPPINPTSTGDGFRMARAIGAGVRNTELVLQELRFHLPSDRAPQSLPSSPLAARAMRIAIERLPSGALAWFARRALTAWVAPSKAVFEAGAILVNADGERFANELDTPARRLGDQAENRAYVVFDGVVADKFSRWPYPISTFPGIAYAYLRDYERFRPDAVHRGETVEVLAQALGMKPDVFAGTVERYNAVVVDGNDPLERTELGEGLHRPPYYALGPLGGFVTLTDGGVTVDTQCRVLNEEGSTIPGLYAVGSNGQGGLILKNHGLHIGWAITSGRIAGAAAAQPIPQIAAQ